MIVTYLFSSPKGDVLLDPENLSRPFLIAPEKAHPHLTLGDYFDTLRKCILEDEGELLKGALKSASPGNFNPGEIQEIQIRSEKHGVLYHLASVEVIGPENRFKFTMSTAVSQEGQDCILQEHDILHRLNRRSRFSFLPDTYGIRKTVCHTARGTDQEMVMLAAQWFEDFHEWHVTEDPLGRGRKIAIWDFKRGPRYASAEEAYSIIEACARILTLYYDFENFSQIRAWHHAAGDFIVRCPQGNKPEVRLTTIRNYAPLMAAFSEEPMDPTTALIYFFLDISLKMRLDRLDGVGETVWLGDFAVAATVKGFFDGLRELETEKIDATGGRADSFLSLLKSFDESELTQVFLPLLDRYAEQDSMDMDLLSARVEDHITLLLQVLQDFQ